MTPQSSTERPSLHWPSALQLALSLLVVLGTLGLAGLIVFSAVFALLTQNFSNAEALGSLMTAFACLVAALTAFYSAYFAYQRVSPSPFSWSWFEKIPSLLMRKPGWLVLLWLLLGAALSQSEILALFALPPIHALTVSTIFLGLFLIASRGINLGSRQRLVGVFASGLIIGPAFALIVEIIVGFILLLVLGIYLGTQSIYTELINRFSQLEISTLSEMELLEMLRPLGDDPWILVSAFLFIAVLVPLIEELIKPIGLYLSLNRPWSPATGFAFGALSGAGFALFENLSLAASASEWLPLVTARIGTTAMHMLTSGLVGWSIASARQEKRYWRILWAYLTAVFLHGLWNGLAILIGFATIFEESAFLNITPSQFFAMLFGLLILAVGSIFLLRFNRRKLLALG